MAGLTSKWRKSSRSGDNGACVEVRRTSDAIEVRDSTNKTGPVLTFTFAEWARFVVDIKHSNSTV